MSSNFQVHRAAFIEYLKQMKGTSGFNNPDDFNDISLFLYANEFKDFLSSNENVDYDKLIAELEELDELEFKDGQISSSNEDDKNNNKNFFTDFLNDLFKDKDFIKKVDKNGNNKIDEDEYHNFLDFSSIKDKNGKDLSLKDIFKSIDNIKENKYDFDASTSNETDKTEDVEETSGSSGASGSGGSGGGGGGGGGGIASTPQENKAPQIDYSNKSLEELKEMQTDEQKSYDANKEKVQAVFSGQDEITQKLNEETEAAENELKEAIENDEEISEELAEKKNTISENLKTKEQELNDCQSQIIEYEANIFQAESEQASIESNIGALESSLASLSGQTSDDPEIQAQIQSQIAAVQAQITTQKSNLEDKKEQIVELNTKKDEANEKADSLGTELDTLFEQEKAVNEEILAVCGEETKAALENYNTTKVTNDKLKLEAIIESMSIMNDSQTKLNGINKAIDIKEAQETKKENRIKTDKDFFDPDIEMETQYITDDPNMPYMLIGPKNADPNEELPVLVYLHGGGETGNNLHALDYVGPGRNIPNWDLENFNGYIICPQLPGGDWNTPEVEQKLRGVINGFKETHAVREDKVSIAGHSLGGIGTVYMAEKMGDVFNKAVVLSGYSAGTDLSNIKIPIMGYVGGMRIEDKPEGDTTNPADNFYGGKQIFDEESQPDPTKKYTYIGGDDSSFQFMYGEFAEHFGCKNVITFEAEHGNVPNIVLNKDSDGNGRSDFFEWLMADE